MTTIQVISPMWPTASAKIYGIFVKNTCDALAARGFEIDARAVIRGSALGFRNKARAHLGLGLNIAKATLSEADCIYLHAPTWFAPLVQLTAIPKHKPIVVHMHGAEVFPGSTMERMTKPAVAWLSRRADLIVVPSIYYGREVERAFQVQKDRIFVSPSGGVNTRLFQPLDASDKREARRALGIPLDAEVLGYVGRIADGKGWDTFVDALAHLAQDRPRLIGLVIGEGDEVGAFEKRVEERGVTARIVRHGFWPQAELVRAYGLMDVFLFPARRKSEALGLAPIEALACGTPVVGSNVSAVPEYVLDRESGFLANAFAPAEFAEKVARILDAPEREKEALRRGARAVAERFDSEVVAAKLADAMREVIARRRS